MENKKYIVNVYRLENTSIGVVKNRISSKAFCNEKEAIDFISNNTNSNIVAICDNIQHTKTNEILNKKETNKLPRKCPSCNKYTNKNSVCIDCGMCFGRRGWRYLGEYDG